MTVNQAVRQRSQSEEDFREIVCNITGLRNDDPVFDLIEDEDKRVIKAARRAIDMNYEFKKATMVRTKGQIFLKSDLPRMK